MLSAVVVGTGLIGTSAALALSNRGVNVHLRDLDPLAVRTAASLGSGTGQPPEGVVDLAVVAVPPAMVGRVLRALQDEGVARHYTDVAGVKGGLEQDLGALDCDMRRYIGGHPMAGAERSGPLAARGDLFEGRAWVLTPTAETDTETLNTALELVALCGATPVVMGAAAHDMAVGLVSHMPHLVASLVAMRLTQAEGRAVSLAGPSIRDLTRIAASDPRLWVDILSANAGVVADLLEELAADLDTTIGGLRAMAATDDAKRAHGAEVIEDVLRQGNTGRARIPGKHDGRPVRYAAVSVLIGDQPGEMARLFTDAGRSGVNIEDVRLEHATGRLAGVVYLSVAQESVALVENTLQERGWRLR
ncbi:prephenate dehydrogenase [Streptomyces mirabilis]|uniref:prephenate dehydrogenase n=1 Tax=Streptomyces mirabilis TaxID=68239 RepID=UPI001BB03324|nr:prephenate dehydrogenase [Streptomyces mirabilis]QUW84571.1 prephenate dehydrogenase [Streptomyces mirabilis]